MDILEGAGTPFAGSLLLASDLTPLTAASPTRDVGPIDTHKVTSIGGDIRASHACTLQVIPLPDGVSEGEPSTTLIVSAVTPTRWTYSNVKAPAVLLRIVNTSGADMTSLALYTRGEG